MMDLFKQIVTGMLPASTGVRFYRSVGDGVTYMCATLLGAKTKTGARASVTLRLTEARNAGMEREVVRLTEQALDVLGKLERVAP
jgi:hypothetical protein